MKTILLLLVIAAGTMANAQPERIRKLYRMEEYSPEEYREMKRLYGKNKEIPPQFEAQVLLALSAYPELKDCRITFLVKKTRTPLTSRPQLNRFFGKKMHRNYVITISEQSIPALDTILLKNLPFNAQIGVLGHELAHISFYQTKNAFQLVKVALCLVSEKWVDKFENETDKSCIRHGLGYQLADWSTEVRKRLAITHWRGVAHVFDASGNRRERYMSPESILNDIHSLGLYKE